MLFARLSQSKTIHLAARPVSLCIVNERQKNDNNKKVKGYKYMGKKTRRKKVNLMEYTQHTLHECCTQFIVMHESRKSQLIEVGAEIQIRIVPEEKK